MDTIKFAFQPRVVIAFLIALSSFMIWNALTLKETQVERLVPKRQGLLSKFAAHLEIEYTAAVQRFSKSIQFKTISYSEENDSAEPFYRFKHYLAASYPLVHQELKIYTVNDLTLIYKWEGVEADLEPILLMAHMDVVPPGNLSSWTHYPFRGTIADGYIWGRGTLDIKQMLMGELEAIEFLLKNDYKPKRTIYLHFGHDEEIGGLNGAAESARVFTSQNISFLYILDEGLSLNKGSIPGFDKVIASVGLAEKGFAKQV